MRTPFYLRLSRLVIKDMIPLNLVTDDEALLKPGDAMTLEKDGRLQLVIVCPGCGKISGSAGNHVYDPVSKSYTPSIVHDVNLGGCGWHGWLTNGVFSKC